MRHTLIPWQERLPRPFSRIEEEMESLMGRFLDPEDGWWTRTEGFTPRSNLVELEGAFEVTVDLPGMKPEDFNIELKDGNLWISGETNQEKEEKGKTFHRVERHQGEFRRMFRLPGNVDEDGIAAEYKDGVLKITVPKTEESKAKHIEVKA